MSNRSDMVYSPLELVLMARISELEQCIRENYEALRDKKTYSQPSELPLYECCFMEKAESLIPTLKQK